MKEFQNKVAMVTGAASGIGRALAEKSAALGMKLVLADVEEPALQQAEQELKASGADVMAVRTDVSQARDVEALANLTFTTYGAVHLLFNNAGVSEHKDVWDTSLADWQWVLGVNLWGVIYGIHFFVPRMLAQGSEGHIVNTASGAGLTAHAGQVAYTVSKHGVVALSETLALELAASGASLKASLLVPGWVNTRIAESARNRPQALQNAAEQEQVSPAVKLRQQAAQQLEQAGMSSLQVAEMTFDAIRQDKFYILTDPNLGKQAVQMRMEDILQERSPRDAYVALFPQFQLTGQEAYAATNAPANSRVVNIIRQVFGPYADSAIRVARCESGLNPSATNPSSGAAGLFQIMPATFRSTSQAGKSPYDAYANTVAAHEIFVRDGYSWREWVCQP